MIESIEFRNFKVLRATTLPLGRFTLLVGPNGSGKSTALLPLQIVSGREGCGFPGYASAAVKSTPGSVVECILNCEKTYGDWSSLVIRSPFGSNNCNISWRTPAGAENG